MSQRQLFFLILVANAIRIIAADQNAVSDTNCPCGYYDQTTDTVFTESIIVYFNETINPASDFNIEVYTHNYEKNWNAIYRQGAAVDNVQLNKSSGFLELEVSPPRKDHVVIGGSIRSLRRDIQYGSFRSLLKPPPTGQHGASGGSSLSMMVHYNDTESLSMNVMNTINSSAAWTTTLIGDEASAPQWGINFTTLQQDSAINPWAPTEYRFDWTKDEVTWYIGGSLRRSATKKDTSFPDAPGPISITHYSIGNPFSTQGPPKIRAVAQVGWARMFFNSSLMTSDSHKTFDDQCELIDPCSTDDWTLRTSSPYSPEAIVPWKQKDSPFSQRWIAILMAVSCLTCSLILVIHTLLPRVMAKFRSKKTYTEQGVSSESGEDPFRDPQSRESTGSQSDISRMGHRRGSVPLSLPSTSGAFKLQSKSEKRISESPSLRMTDEKLAFWQQAGSARRVDVPWSASPTVIGSPFDSPFDSPMDSRTATMVTFTKSYDLKLGETASRLESIDKIGSRATTMVNSMHNIVETHDTIHEDKKSEDRDRIGFVSIERRGDFDEKGKGKEMDATVIEKFPVPPGAGEKDKPVLATKQRVDYLAGLTAICAIIVSVDHFFSTFSPAIMFPAAPHHYKVEVWMNRYVAPYFLNQIWIGVFFTCSTRFLVTKYLKAGKLVWIAEKAVTRNFRVMIPIIFFAMLEYFLMECGAITWLQYLPSLTWSTWPYAIPYTTFGNFVSEILEIVYLQPNAAPQIIFNYCTGVFWTMPVQLQGSWVVLLGVVIIREIKTPWKRFSYYAICVLLNWYASSWGSYFWLGLLLADMDITFKYRKSVQSRSWLFYLLTITYGLLTLASLTVDAVNQIANYSFIDREHSVHPDIYTGLPIYQAIQPTRMPAYYVPRLNGIIFAFSLQSLIELSPLFQKIFSCKPLTLIFPHIFTIYLLHGLVFWSLGSMICVFLSVHGFVYGVNIFIVFISCYAALGVSLPIVTPIVEVLGKSLTATIWEHASETPPPRRPTLFPFSKEMLLGRKIEDASV